MLAPAELLSLQPTDPDSGLAWGQAELSGDAFKPQRHPQWVVAVLGSPAQFTNPGLGRYKDYSGGKVPQQKQPGRGRAWEAPAVTSFPDLQPRHNRSFPPGLSRRVPGPSAKSLRCPHGAPLSHLWSQAWCSPACSLPCSVCAPARPYLPARGQPGGERGCTHAFCRV